MVSSQLKSVEEAIGEVHVAGPHSFHSSCGKVLAGSDLVAVEDQAVRDFVNGTGRFAGLNVDNSRKRIVLVRYTMSNERIIQALSEAKAAGLKKIQIVTDLNEAMKAELSGSETETSDFDEAEYREGENGECVRKLHKAGFNFNGRRFAIYSQPLYRGKGHEDGTRIPLMHQKELFLIVDGEDGKPERVFSFFSTGNLSSSPRYNRLYYETDPLASIYGLQHAERMIKIFRDGDDDGEQGIKNIPRTQPLRITYGDGSFQEIAYTDGHDNWNHRITLLLERALNSSDVKVKEVVFSHFVITLTETVEALKRLMLSEKGRDLTVTGVLDDKFIDPHGFGMAAALAGCLVSRPLGDPVWGFPESLRARMQLFGYQRLAPGGVETTLLGPPGFRHLWHDKSTLILTEENGTQWAYLFTGSFNLSGNKANAERQVLYRMRADSPLVRAIRESIVEVARSEPAYALPLEKAVFRNMLAQMLGHSIFELPVDMLEKLLSAAKDGDFVDVERTLIALYQRPTTLHRKAEPELVAQRVSRFLNFLRWYPSVPAELRRERFLSLQGMVSLMMAITFEEEDSPLKTWQQLQSIFWRPSLKDARARFNALLDETVTLAWKNVLAFDKKLPRFKKQADDHRESEVEPLRAAP